MHSKRRKPLFYFAQGCAYAAGAWTHKSGVSQGRNVHHPCRSTLAMYYLQGRSVCRLCQEHTSGINQGCAYAAGARKHKSGVEQGCALYHSCMDTLTGGCLKQCIAYRGQIDSPKAHEANSQMNNQYQTFRLIGNGLCQK